MGHVRDWAPPGWYWEALPAGGHSLVRSQPVVDPNLLWWRSRGPVMVQRLEDSAEVVRHRVSEEDTHVRRYLFALEHRFSNTWQVRWANDQRYDLVMVLSLWVSTARAGGTASVLDSSVVFDLC